MSYAVEHDTLFDDNPSRFEASDAQSVLEEALLLTCSLI